MSGDGEDVKHESMVRLLQRIIATKEDFSNENLLKIGAHPCLVNALLEMMDRNAAGYLLLIKLFSKVIDVEVLRLHVLDAISSISRPDAINFTLLEQSFPPDQGHLARFVENPVDTRCIDSTAVRLYVGYGIRYGHMRYWDLESWCLKAEQPGVLMAFAETYNRKSMGDEMNLLDGIWFDVKFPGPYKKGMLEKLPLLQETSQLFIDGMLDCEDVRVLVRMLVEPSSLNHLFIAGDIGSAGLHMLMRALAENQIIESIEVSEDYEGNDDPTNKDFPISVSIASLLNANRIIKRISIDFLPYVDAERAALIKLAESDRRLELRTIN